MVNYQCHIAGFEINRFLEDKLNLKDMFGYVLLTFFVAFLAFFLDIISSHLTVEIGPRNLLGKDGSVISTIEVTYPLWHQIINLFKNFLYGLAAAIFITVFVANKLQRTQQEEKENALTKLNEAININVFDSLFKTIIPDEIFKIIKREIIENKVIRREAKWILNFSVSDNEAICCTHTTRYELHNLSQVQVSDPIKLKLDSLGGEKYNIISAECLSRAGEILVQYKPKDNIHKNVIVKDDGRTIIAEYTVDIPPENYVEYKTVYDKLYHGDITDALGTLVPIVGADIIVSFPEGYDFDISPLMSSVPRLINQSGTQKIFRVEGGILPNQGFIFYLVKNKASLAREL